MSDLYIPVLAGLVLVAVAYLSWRRFRLPSFSRKELENLRARHLLVSHVGHYGIWNWDVVNDVLEWDDELYELYGVRRDQFRAAYEAWASTVLPEDLVRCHEEVRAALAGEKDFDTEFRIRLGDGSVRVLRGVATVRRDAAGTPLRMIGMNWDVTAQHEAQEALRKSEQRFRNLFETSRHGIVYAKLDGGILEANPAYQTMLGYTLDELRGLSFKALTPEKWRDMEDDIIATRIMVYGYADEYEKEYIRKDGSVFPIAVRGWLIRDDDGHPAGLWGVVRDISERKESEARINALLKQQQAIFDAADYSIIATSPDGIITTFNRAAERMLGYRADEMVGLATPAVLHDMAETRERAKALTRELGYPVEGFDVYVAKARSGEPDMREWTYVRKDGSRVPVLLSVTAMRDDEGNIEGFMGIASDISERKRQEDAFRQSEQNLNRAQAVAQVGSWHLDLQAATLTWSDQTYQIFGLPKGQPLSYDAFLERIHPEDREVVNAAWEHALLGEPYDIEHRVVVNGEIKWLRERAELVFDEEGHPLGGTGTVQDVTERKQLLERLELSDRVFTFTGEAIMITDVDNRILSVNHAFTRLTGYTLDEVKGQNPHLLSSGRHDLEFYREMWAHILEHGHWEGEIWDRRKDGSQYPKWLSIDAIRQSSGGKVLNYVAVFSDLTQRKAQEAYTHHIAYHDALTGLPNRVLFHDRLRQAIAEARREEARLALLFIDLDRFKDINDTQGHHIGDQVLQQVGERLLECVRESDTVARLGGDEFVIILPLIRRSGEAAMVAEKVQQQVARPISVEQQTFLVTPSIGIGVFPDDGESVEVLMKNADVAMYNAKHSGRNNFQFFTPEMNRAAHERVLVEQHLRRALQHGEFELHYQPKVEIASGRVIGCEALVRWNHPDWGMVSPARFIPVAEETGLIVPLGEWIMHAAAEQGAKWAWQGMEMQVAVNVSGRQFRDRELAAKVEAILAQSGLSHARYELEITESTLVDDIEHAGESLRAFKAMDLSLAIDDFGTGYSSLSYLKTFEIDKLKIDQSFIRDIHQDPDDAAIVRAVVSLAHELGLKVIAEGVEDEKQLQFLRGLGCDIAQGYYFARPLPAREFERFYEKNRETLQSMT